MIVAVDSSVFIDYLQGRKTDHVAFFDERLQQNEVVLPPVVLAEILSNPREDRKTYRYIQDLVLLELDEGYWQRAGLLRRKLLESGFKAKLGDSLIAQSCIDHDIPLLTRDTDFRHYVKHGGLKLVKPR